MEKADVYNGTVITKFILLGFGNLSELKILLFFLFLVIYVVTVAGNMLIVALVVLYQHLHTPMYFFLGNLSCLEICYSSNILPRILTNFLTGDKTISVHGCIIQFYLFSFLGGIECYLLAVMSYDRYLAICKPLHYSAFVNGRFCLMLTAGSGIWALLASTIIACLMSQLTFCGPSEIDHFFCDFNPLIKRSCNDVSFLTVMSFILASIGVPFPFLLTLVSYICIIATILRIPSTIGKKKAFSTCSSHLIVVTIFYGTLIIVYILPDTDTLRDLNKVFSVFYIVLIPLLNPLIYSLRNKGVKEALRKVIHKVRVLTEVKKK